MRGYRKANPLTKHEKALPPIIYRHIINRARTGIQLAKAHFLAGALFYAMRSCKYSMAQGKSRCTKTIRLKDIQFYKGKRELPHTHLYLHLADPCPSSSSSRRTTRRESG